jgi:hypothetical protein
MVKMILIKLKKNLIEIYKWKNQERKKLQILCFFINTKKTISEINEYKKVFGPFVEDINLNIAYMVLRNIVNFWMLITLKIKK